MTLEETAVALPFVCIICGTRVGEMEISKLICRGMTGGQLQYLLENYNRNAHIAHPYEAVALYQFPGKLAVTCHFKMKCLEFLFFPHLCSYL